MSARPHGPTMPGQLGALLVASLVMATWCAAGWVIRAWPHYPLRWVFGL